MNAKLAALIAAFDKALAGKDTTDIKTALTDFIKGNPAEQAAAQTIAANVLRNVEGVKAGTYTAEELRFALEQARLDAITYAEEKIIRIKVAALNIFFDAITLGLNKLL